MLQTGGLHSAKKMVICTQFIKQHKYVLRIAFMKLKLNPERKEKLINDLVGLFSEAFDTQLSPFRSEEIVDFMLQEIGPIVYNQAINDAHKTITEKIEDMSAELFFPDKE